MAAQVSLYPHQEARQGRERNPFKGLATALVQKNNRLWKGRHLHDHLK